MSKKKSPKAKPIKTPVRSTAVCIKGTHEWKEWVESGAKFCRTDVAKLVDAALSHYLQANGYVSRPPLR